MPNIHLNSDQIVSSMNQISELAGGQDSSVGRAISDYCAYAADGSGQAASPLASRVLAGKLLRVYEAIEKTSRAESSESARAYFSEYLGRIASAGASDSPHGQMAASLIRKINQQDTGTSGSAILNADDYYASMRKGIAMGRQRAAEAAMNSMSAIDTSADAETGAAMPVQVDTHFTTIDRSIVAELAQAGTYLDNPAYGEAAARTGISMREYCSGLLEAYSQAGGDPESDQAKFLRSIAENPDYDSFTVDQIRTVDLGSGEARMIGISDGSGQGMVGVSANADPSSYTSGTSEYSAAEQQLAQALKEVSAGYSRFDVSGVGQGGQAAVIAAMQLDGETDARLGQVNTLSSNGFSRKYVSLHAADAERIAGRTQNYIPASWDQAVTDASSFLSGESGVYIGSENYMVANREGVSDESWMNWSVDKDGEFRPDYQYRAETPAEGGGSGSGGDYGDPYDSESDTDYDYALAAGAAGAGAAGSGYDGGYDDGYDSGYTDTSTPSSSGGSGGGYESGGYDSGDQDSPLYQTTKPTYFPPDSESGDDDNVAPEYHEGQEDDVSDHTTTTVFPPDTESGGENEGGEDDSGDDGTNDSRFNPIYFDTPIRFPEITPGPTDRPWITWPPTDSDSGDDSETDGYTGPVYEDPDLPGYKSPENDSSPSDGNYDSGYQDSNPSGDSGPNNSYPNTSNNGDTRHNRSDSGENGSENGGQEAEIVFVPQAVLNAAGDLINLANRVRRERDTMDSMLRAAGGIWQGGSSNTMRKAVKNVSDQVMTAGNKYLKDLAQKLCVTEENYKAAEQSNVENNQSVSSMFA